MFEFGRELRRIFRQHDRIDADASLYELMNLQMLIAQGRQFDIEGGRVSTRDRFTPYIQAALIWREYARRTGDPVAVRRAAASAENAGKAAQSAQEAAQAALEQALTCLLSHDLFETGDLLSSAEDLLATGRAATPGDESLRARYNRAEAQLAMRLAVRQGVGEDLELAMLAMSHIDRAVERADQRVLKTHAGADKIEAALARLMRADLLMLVGMDRGDASLMAAVIKDFEALRARLDPAYAPVTHARVTLRLAQAHIGRGEIEGRPEAVSEGVALLSRDDAIFDYEHAPLDWVAHQQALAAGLQVLGELTLNADLHEKAMAVYDLALKRPLQKGLSMRARLIEARAACLTRHAESQGSLKALDVAEAAFKTELRAIRAHDDPVAWAILQWQLARIYVARGEISGFMMERAEAAYALEAALDIFREQGLDAMMATASALQDSIRAL
ncbi:MAG TPA: hypothetical protein VF402_05215 [Asticcacaulis sp.]